MFRLLLAGILAVIARGAEAPVPSRFYVVSAFFSDSGGLHYRVLDVREDGSDVVARYIRIATSNIYCSRRVVQAVASRVNNSSITKLIGHTNPCAFRPDALRRPSNDTRGPKPSTKL